MTGSDDPADVAAIPSLAIGMAPLHRPSYEPGLNAIVALASVHARGHPAHFLAADRAYTNAKAEKFQLPARALGYRLVLDYKKDQLGIQDSFAGFVQIEGWWYSPSIPPVLANATADYRNGVIDEELYHKRLEERWLYRARARSHPDAEGHIRVSCPASCGMARCELKPASLTLAATRGKLRIPVRPDIRADPPLSCRQASVTIPPEAGAKFAQELLFGSPEWDGVYSTLRNSIEGFNGYVKDGPTRPWVIPDVGVCGGSPLKVSLLRSSSSPPTCARSRPSWLRRRRSPKGQCDDFRVVVGPSPSTRGGQQSRARSPLRRPTHLAPSDRSASLFGPSWGSNASAIGLGLLLARREAIMGRSRWLNAMLTPPRAPPSPGEAQEKPSSARFVVVMAPVLSVGRGGLATEPSDLGRDRIPERPFPTLSLSISHILARSSKRVVPGGRQRMSFRHSQVEQLAPPLVSTAAISSGPSRWSTASQPLRVIQSLSPRRFV